MIPCCSRHNRQRFGEPDCLLLLFQVEVVEHSGKEIARMPLDLGVWFKAISKLTSLDLVCVCVCVYIYINKEKARRRY